MNVALRRLGQAGDDVDQRGLAGAVRPDEEAQLALLDREVDAVEGLEAVEVDDDAARAPAARVMSLASASGSAGGGSRRPSRSAPRRLGSASPTSLSEPDDAAGDEGHHDDEQQALEVQPVVGLLLADASSAPVHEDGAETAPQSVPRPPTATQQTIRIDGSNANWLGATMPMTGAASAPASAGHAGRRRRRRPS